MSLDGCLDKEDLIARAKVEFLGFQNPATPGADASDLEDEPDAPDDTPENSLCIICFEKVRTTVLLNCAHLATCYACSRPLEQCPICRQDIIRRVKTYQP